jgi:hypothetical protein
MTSVSRSDQDPDNIFIEKQVLLAAIVTNVGVDDIPLHSTTVEYQRISLPSRSVHFCDEGFTIDRHDENL